MKTMTDQPARLLVPPRTVGFVQYGFHLRVDFGWLHVVLPQLVHGFKLFHLERHVGRPRVEDYHGSSFRPEYDLQMPHAPHGTGSQTNNGSVAVSDNQHWMRL